MSLRRSMSMRKPPLWASPRSVQTGFWTVQTGLWQPAAANAVKRGLTLTECRQKVGRRGGSSVGIGSNVRYTAIDVSIASGQLTARAIAIEVVRIAAGKRRHDGAGGIRRKTVQSKMPSVVAQHARFHAVVDLERFFGKPTQRAVGAFHPNGLTIRSGSMPRSPRVSSVPSGMRTTVPKSTSSTFRSTLTGSPGGAPATLDCSAALTSLASTLQSPPPCSEGGLRSSAL